MADKYTRIGERSVEGNVGSIKECSNGKIRLTIAVHTHETDAFGEVQEQTTWVTAFAPEQVALKVAEKYDVGDHVRAKGLMAVRECEGHPEWGGHELLLNRLELVGKKGAPECEV